jgi:hypothetical protein
MAEAARGQVLDVLDAIGLPTTLSGLSHLLAVSGGRVLSPRELARLRRRDERQRAEAQTRPAWLAPAISPVGLVAVAAMLTRSDWPLEQRILGSRTARTSHLRLLLTLLGSIAGQPDPASAVARLVVRYAESVPGALGRGESLDPQRVRAAAEAERGTLLPLDRDERLSAAGRLAGLPERYQLWGRPALIEPATDQGRSSA